jgi:hypothetical protein
MTYIYNAVPAYVNGKSSEGGKAGMVPGSITAKGHFVRTSKNSWRYRKIVEQCERSVAQLYIQMLGARRVMPTGMGLPGPSFSSTRKTMIFSTPFDHRGFDRPGILLPAQFLPVTAIYQLID